MIDPLSQPGFALDTAYITQYRPTTSTVGDRNLSLETNADSISIHIQSQTDGLVTSGKGETGYEYTAWCPINDLLESLVNGTYLVIEDGTNTGTYKLISKRFLNNNSYIKPMYELSLIKLDI